MNATTTHVRRAVIRSRARWHVFAVATLLVAAPLFAAEDLVLSNKFGEVTVEIFIPGDVPTLRGLVLHAANYKLKPNDRWAEWGRVIGFGHLSLDIDRKANNRPNKLRAAMDQALPIFAKESSHAELPTLPLVGAGHSAGGWVTQIILKTPERAIAAAIDCAWVVDATKLNPPDKSVPMLFTMGAIPDAFKMLPDITNKFVPARLDNWPWALGVQHGCAHDFGNAATLQIPWLQAAIEARLPVAGSKLRDVKVEDGWLGDIDSISNQWATIAPYREFKGDRARAAWLPNRAVAYVWRAWQTKDSPVVLEASAGSAKLPAWSPKSSRDLTVDSGTTVELGVSAADASPAKVQFFDGDRMLGEATSRPWKWNWMKPPPGAHAIHAVWESADGKPHAANPALIIVRATAHK